MKLKALVLLFSIFLFILPVPGTIALRHVLMLCLLFLLASACKKVLGRKTIVNSASLVLGVVLISAWLYFQAIYISNETTWALRELRGQWLPASLLLIIGILLVATLNHAGWDRSQILGFLSLSMLAQTLASVLMVMPAYIKTGTFPQGDTWFTAGKLEISYWNNLLLVLLMVDGLSRWLSGRHLTNLPTAVVVGGVFLAIGSNLAFGARAGVIGSILLLLSIMTIVVWHERKRIHPKRLLMFVIVSAVSFFVIATLNYHLDSRWKTFKDSAVLAWSKGGGEAWLRPDVILSPTLATGEPAERSAYFRISWIRAGLDLVADYPLGVGYGRNAFGHALKKTNETRLGHAHSGIIDWTVGTGLPGLVLWLGLLGSLLALGLRRYFRKQDAVGLVLVFAVGGFFGRMLIDSINRDHMLMLFFLILGILVALPEESAAS